MVKAARVLFLAAAFAPCPWLFPAGARAPSTLPGEDARPRSEVPLDVAPWRALVRVQTRYGVRCTGFLIAPAIAMTAAHCLYAPLTGHLLQPTSVHVLLRYRRGQYAAHAQAVRLIVPNGYDPAREAGNEGRDRAVLLLDHPIAASAEVLRIAPALPPPGTGLALAGYGADREEVAVRGPPCRLLAVRQGVLQHDCTGTRGTSGAPLLARDAAGRWVVVGVQIEARIGGAGGRASALTAAPGSATPSDRPSGR
nr:trypsin-like serine protease [uncultured Lichenicoccus sp.]